MSDYWDDKIKENKEVFKKWKAILDKDELYNDIEYELNGSPGNYLLGPNKMDFVRKGSNRIASNTAYYECARSFRWWLREEGQHSLDEIRVWDLHAAGYSVKNITIMLDLSRWFVSKTIKAVRKLMDERLVERLAPFEGD